MCPGMYPRLHDSNFKHQHGTREGRTKIGVGDVHGQTDINEQITTATSDEPSRSRREQDRDLNKIHRPKTTTDRKKDISVTTTRGNGDWKMREKLTMMRRTSAALTIVDSLMGVLRYVRVV